MYLQLLMHYKGSPNQLLEGSLTSVPSVAAVAVKAVDARRFNNFLAAAQQHFKKKRRLQLCR